MAHILLSAQPAVSLADGYLTSAARAIRAAASLMAQLAAVSQCDRNSYSSLFFKFVVAPALKASVSANPARHATDISPCSSPPRAPRPFPGSSAPDNNANVPFHASPPPT